KISNTSYVRSTTCRTALYIPNRLLLSACAWEGLPLHRGHVEIIPRLGHGCPMSLSSRPRSDRGQMDGTDHPVAVEADNALRRAPARDRRDFAKDADANAPQPGA